MMIWSIYKKAMFDITSYDISNHYTAQTMAYNHVMSQIPSGQVKLIQDDAIDAWIRSEIVQGGRVFPQRGMFRNEHFKSIMSATTQTELRRLYESCLRTGHYLHDLDARSLYPSAMTLFEYPANGMHWYEGDLNFEDVRKALNSCDENFSTLLCYL